MNNDYSKVAWCTELTTAEQEYFHSIKAMKVNTSVINLTIGNNGQSIKAVRQIRAARNAGMIIHVSHIAEFKTADEARAEAEWFMMNSQLLQFDQNVIHVLIYRPCEPVKNASMLINTFQQALYRKGYRKQDLCTGALLVTDGIIKVEELLMRPNLTVIDYYCLAPSITGAGTWIFKDTYLYEEQLMSYDFMDYYAKAGQTRGRQLSLDVEYIAQNGDTYWQISNQLGIPLPTLLMLNDAQLNDKVVPGQRIRIS